MLIFDKEQIYRKLVKNIPYAPIKSDPNGKLQTMAWGMRQFSILDNSGNIIHFGQDIKS